MQTCLNCSNHIDGKFCSECGQKAATHRFTMHEWLHEIPHSIFHVDGGFFHTLKNLCTRPGRMIGEYLAGRRKSYFSPFLYVLIMCGVFVVVSHLFADPTHKKIEITSYKAALDYLTENYYKAIVVAMIVPSAIGSYLLFIKSGYNFAEHLVLNTFIVGQLIIGDIIIYCINLNPEADKYKRAVFALNLLLKFPFWMWAYWQFFKPKKILLGILQVLFAVFLASIFASLMLEGFAYIFYLVKTGAQTVAH